MDVPIHKLLSEGAFQKYFDNVHVSVKFYHSVCLSQYMCIHCDVGKSPRVGEFG